MGERSACRPLALHVADPATSLSFGLALEPTSDHAELPAGTSGELALDARTLAAVAQALEATDVSYL